MTPSEQAAQRRATRARTRRRAVLAGGYGRAAQEAAWDAALPGWREALAAVIHMGGADDAQRALMIKAGKVLTADNRYLAKPWHALAMQTMYRRAGWGMHPI